MGRWWLLPVTALLVLLFNCAGVAGDEETPRKGVDRYDKFWFQFVTRPDIQAPKYSVHIYDEKALAPGYWFIAPYENIHKLVQGKHWEGPYIYDNGGDLIWAGTPTMDYYMVNDFRVQRFNNEDMLTGISFRDNAGLFFNKHYELVKAVSWTQEWAHANMHEFQLVEGGTRALGATRNRHTNLSLEESATVGYKGHCTVRADGIREVDITVDPPEITFDWLGIDHLPLSESVKNKSPEKVREVCGKDWDIHHFNALDKFSDGDFLASSRETDTIYKISHVDGHIVWRLGGKKSDFPLHDKARFGAQHLVRIINDTETHATLSIFANGHPNHSAGMVVSLDFRAMTIELLQEAPHPTKGHHVGSRGGTQLLPNGNMFSCLANHGRVAEHDSNGKVLMYSWLKRDYDEKGESLPSYRGFKFEWVGMPKYPPTVYAAAFELGTASLATDGKRIITRVFVSWNGATEVAKWNLYESNEDGSELKFIDNTKKRRFESNFWYDGHAEYVVVEAVDKNDQPLEYGRSPVFRTIPPIGNESPQRNVTIISRPPIEKIDESHDADTNGQFDYDYEPGYADHFDPGYGHGLDNSEWEDESPDDFWILDIFMNPISTYIAGFSTCAAMWAGIRIFERLRRRSKDRRRGVKYQKVDSEEQEVFFDEAEDQEFQDDVELKERAEHER